MFRITVKCISNDWQNRSNVFQYRIYFIFRHVIHIILCNYRWSYFRKCWKFYKNVQKEDCPKSQNFSHQILFNTGVACCHQTESCKFLMTNFLYPVIFARIAVYPVGLFTWAPSEIVCFCCFLSAGHFLIWIL